MNPTTNPEQEDVITPEQVDQAPLAPSEPQPIQEPVVTVTPPRRSRKTLVILLIILGVIALGVATYGTWVALQPVENTTVQTSTEETTITTPDSQVTVEDQVTDIESQLDGLDDAELQDDTLSDASLYEN
ncbi:hypothetical protein LRY29_00085 [Candidatus Saccharibacteria bacterium]|nr:hypothetical protein [Candidatus Saccharibacteria bacterium]